MRVSQGPRPKVNEQAVRDKVKELRDEIEKLEAQKTPAGNLAMGVVEATAPMNCQVLVRGEIKR